MSLTVNDHDIQANVAEVVENNPPRHESVLPIVSDLLSLLLRFGLSWEQLAPILHKHDVDMDAFKRVVGDGRTFKDFHK